MRMMNDFHWAWNFKKPECKILRVWIKKLRKILKIFLIFFDQNLYGKLTFFTFFTKYFLDFWLLSENIYLLKITPDLYKKNFDFGGGDIPAFPPPLPTLLAAAMNEISINFEMLQLFELNYSSIYDNHNETIVY